MLHSILVLFVSFVRQSVFHPRLRIVIGCGGSRQSGKSHVACSCPCFCVYAREFFCSSFSFSSFHRTAPSHIHQPVLAAHIHLMRLFLSAQWAREDDVFRDYTREIFLGNVFENNPNNTHVMYLLLDRMQFGNLRQFSFQTSPSFGRMYQELQEYVLIVSFP
jgi:hypothetical protein